MSLHALLLGTGAGGGLPQWNCGCPNCSAARRGDGAVEPRTQSSLAVSGDGERWLLVNASPDVRQQIAAHAPLGPGDAVRGTGVEAVLLTDAEVDHSHGVLLLREADELAVVATPAVREALTRGNGLLPTLAAFLELEWRPLEVEAEGGEAALAAAGLEIRAFPLPGGPPSYADASPSAGDVVGLEVRDPDTGGRLVYAPSFGRLDADLRERVARADAALLDGTLWTDEEMAAVGSDRTAADMDHLPVSGPGGSLEALEALEDVRKIYVHVNNTNPMLRRGSPERRAVEAAGFEVGRDGMSLKLPETEERDPHAHDSADVAGRAG